ncbi:MAG: class I SAM-dependent methyltransferase, partial [Paracoccaceae bacterium]
MSALGPIIAAQIRRFGAMSIADYMTLCLLHPEHGYYTTQNALGRAGDFTTAPEISQMFGELLGLALAQAWLDQGSPVPFILAEPGPGRGTLMADILRATARVPGFREAADIHLIEASPLMRDAQRSRLAGNSVVWHDRIEDLPGGPLFLVANEFFDALPLRQYIRGKDGWQERVIGLDGDRLTYGLGPPLAVDALGLGGKKAAIGDLVETSPAAQAIAGEIARRIRDHGGVAIIVDYGAWGSGWHTFQAIRAHEKTDPLAHPGNSDLSAHVDFSALARAAKAAKDVAFAGPVEQGALLERLGIAHRSNRLAQEMSGKALEAHRAALRRLTHGDEMGSL